MVEDVAGGDGDLRAKIPPILDDMRDKGELTKIDDEFRLLSVPPPTGRPTFVNELPVSPETMPSSVPNVPFASRTS